MQSYKFILNYLLSDTIKVNARNFSQYGHWMFFFISSLLFVLLLSKIHHFALTQLFIDVHLGAFSIEYICQVHDFQLISSSSHYSIQHLNRFFFISFSICTQNYLESEKKEMKRKEDYRTWCRSLSTVNRNDVEF